jgi:nucleoside-diphosphate-sugar epimerase
VHLAAETAGSLADHERNTVRATRNLLEAMARSGTRRLVNVGSVAVLKPTRFGRRLNEASAVDYGNLRRGPYVWAKAEAERLAQEAASSGQIEVRTVRLGPLVDYDAFTAPGRLGRELARVFVAVGRPSNNLAVCSVGGAAGVIRHYVEAFQSAPPLVNLLETPAPSRGEMIVRLRRARPDLSVMWLPFWILRGLNGAAWGVQKVLRPRSTALDLYAAFSSAKYDDAIAATVMDAGRLKAVRHADTDSESHQTGPA